MKERVLYNPLTDKFTTLGDKFEKIAHNKVNGMYCYKRTADKIEFYMTNGFEAGRYRP